MTRPALLAVVAAQMLVAGVVAGGCGGGAFLDADAPVELGAFDPALLSNAATLVFSFSTTKKCQDLVDKAPDEIGDLLDAEKAPLQVLSPTSQDHVFGKVPPDVPVAYFVLASARADLDQRVDFAQFKGSAFAMGCRDFTAASGTRHDLPLTLFPVGLR